MHRDRISELSSTDSHGILRLNLSLYRKTWRAIRIHSKGYQELVDSYQSWYAYSVWSVCPFVPVRFPGEGMN